MGTQTAGDVPFLQSQGSLGVALTQQASLYEQGYPIQQLYLSTTGGTPELVRSETSSFTFIEDARRRGSLRSKPGEPDQSKGPRYGRSLTKVAYQIYEQSIPPEYASTIMRPGEGIGADATLDATLLERQALQWQDMAQMHDTERCLREFEIWSSQMLSDDEFSLTVDGNSITNVKTGVTINPVTAAWSDAATDIPAMLVKMYRQFIDEAGGPPTHLIYSFRLLDDLGKNEALQAYAQNRNIDPGLLYAQIPTPLLPGPMRGVQMIEHRGHYKDSSNNKAYFWPKYKLTMLRLGAQGRNVIRSVTVPNEQNDYRGGLNSWIYRDPKTRDTGIITSHNGAPGNGDTSQILCWDLSQAA